MFRYCDVSEKDDVRALIEGIVRDFDRLDYACNNAGIHNPGPEFLPETDDNMWDRIIAINLKGVFYCMKYEAGAMLNQKRGVIIKVLRNNVFIDDKSNLVIEPMEFVPLNF